MMLLLLRDILYDALKMPSLQDSTRIFCYPGLRFASTWAMILQPFGPKKQEPFPPNGELI